MKKTAIICGLLALSGCSTDEICVSCQERAAENTEAEVLQTTEEVAEIEYIQPADTCSCAAACQTEVNVLKPRVTEEYSERKTRRCCPDDTAVTEKTTHTVVPNVPEIYMILGGRTAEDMLEGAKAVYTEGNSARFYVEEMTAKSSDLPGGMKKGAEAVRNRLKNISGLVVVENPAEADYTVSTEADWLDTPNKKVPAVKCLLTLKSRDGLKIGEWSEVVHRPEGDKSWW